MGSNKKVEELIFVCYHMYMKWLAISLGILIIIIGVTGYFIFSKGEYINPYFTSPTPTLVQEQVIPTQTPVATTSANLYFVALEDNGKSGEKIGCNDSLVAVSKDISGEDSIQAALNELLSYNQQYYGQSGLYNSLYQSDLKIESITIEDKVASVHLTGTVQVGGVCDNPRFEQQIMKTILQFPSIENVDIYINNKPLQEVLSLQ